MERRIRYRTGAGNPALAYFASTRRGLELAAVNAA